jgi:hypothetical protein
MIGIGIDIGKALWNAYIKYRDEKKFLDLFRMLVKMMEMPNDEFAQKLLDEFIPHAIKNTKGWKKEDRIKKKIVKFCISIPNALKESNYDDAFPELWDKKKEILVKWQYYDNIGIDKLREIFSQQLKEIETEIKSVDKTTIHDVDVKINKYIEAHPLNKEIQKFPMTEQEFNHKNIVNYVRNNFISESGITMELFTVDDYYLNNYINEAFNEIIPKDIYIKDVAGLKWNMEEDDF